MDDKSGKPPSERIDLSDQAACERWAKKLNVTHEQVREAIEAVGDNAGDVEMHLKGVRSTSDDERVETAPKQDSPSSSDKPR